MPTSYQAHLRHATYFLEVAKAQTRMRNEDVNIVKQNLKEFENEWPHILASLEWANENSLTDRVVAMLCVEFYRVTRDLSGFFLSAARKQHCLDVALKAARRLGDQSTILELLSDAAEAKLNAGEAKNAGILLEEALNIARKYRHHVVEAKVLGLLGDVHRQLKNDRKAKAFSEDSSTIIRILQHAELRGADEIQMAIESYAAGSIDYNALTEAVDEALKHILSPERRVELVMQCLKKLDNSIPMLTVKLSTIALTEAQRLNNYTAVAQALTYRASASLALKEDASEYLKEALSLARELRLGELEYRLINLQAENSNLAKNQVQKIDLYAEALEVAKRLEVDGEDAKARLIEEWQSLKPMLSRSDNDAALVRLKKLMSYEFIKRSFLADLDLEEKSFHWQSVVVICESALKMFPKDTMLGVRLQNARSQLKLQREFEEASSRYDIARRLFDAHLYREALDELHRVNSLRPHFEDTDVMIRSCERMLKPSSFHLTYRLGEGLRRYRLLVLVSVLLLPFLIAISYFLILLASDSMSK